MATAMIRKLTARDARLSSFRYYDLLVHVFVVILLISNLVGQKICAVPLFNFHGEAITAKISGAQVLFPITYIFGDIFTEVYGYGASRRAIWLGFFACTILSLMGLFIVWIPAAPDWPNQAAFEAVFYRVPRFIVASLIAFWLGEFTNSYTLAKMKLWTHGKWRRPARRYDCAHPDRLRRPGNVDDHVEPDHLWLCREGSVRGGGNTAHL